MEIYYRWFLFNKVFPRLGVNISNFSDEEILAIITVYIWGFMQRRVPTTIVAFAFKEWFRKKGHLKRKIKSVKDFPSANELFAIIDRVAWDPIPPEKF